MNVLVCSKYNNFCAQLSRRLKKERHETYLLTGSQYGNNHISPNIFQEYHFTYQNENITRIMKNAAPDVVIIGGAMDSHFTWRDAQSQSVEYISGMTNLLMAAKTAGVKRVIYCSSIKVFEGNSEEMIMPDTQPISLSFQAKAYRQVELLCAQYQEPGKFDVEILRFPEVYGELGEGLRTGDICMAMTMEMIKNQVIHYEPNRRRSLLYLDDAVDVLMKVLDQNSTRKLYQVCGAACDEQEIALTLVRISPDKAVRLEELEQVNSHPYPASVSGTQEELLHFKPKYSLEEGLKLLFQASKKVEKHAQKEKKTSAAKKMAVSLLETAGLFVVALLVTIFLSGTWVAETIDFFLIFVVIIAVTYGIPYALFGTLLSTVAKIVFALQSVEQFNSLNDYRFFLSILQLIIVGVIVGFMKDKYKRLNADLHDENTYLQKELADITRINDSNLYVKNVYEKRLVNYKNSLAKIYDITSQLDFMEPRKVIFQAANVAAQTMETKHVAIYIASRKSQFFRLAASSSEKASQMGKSLRFDEKLYFYEALVNHEIYLNRSMDQRQPTFIGATYSDDRVDTIIMVWEEALDQVNLYQSNVMALVCRLIEKSMSRAVLYEESIAEDSYLPGSRVMKFEAFTEIVRTYREGEAAGLLEYTLLRLEIPSSVPVQAVIPDIERSVRDTDYIGMQGNRFYILLSNSNHEEAQFVLQRLKDRNLSAEMVKSETIVGADDE